MGENHFAAFPTAIYGAVMLLAGVAYFILQKTIVAQESMDSKLAAAVDKDVKGMLSLALYTAAVPSAFINQWISETIYILVALMWLIPDKRIG